MIILSYCPLRIGIFNKQPHPVRNWMTAVSDFVYHVMIPRWRKDGTWMRSMTVL